MFCNTLWQCDGSGVGSHVTWRHRATIPCDYQIWYCFCRVITKYGIVSGIGNHVSSHSHRSGRSRMLIIRRCFFSSDIVSIHECRFVLPTTYSHFRIISPKSTHGFPPSDCILFRSWFYPILDCIPYIELISFRPARRYNPEAGAVLYRGLYI